MIRSTCPRRASRLALAVYTATPNAAAIISTATGAVASTAVRRRDLGGMTSRGIDADFIGREACRGTITTGGASTGDCLATGFIAGPWTNGAVTGTSSTVDS